MQGRFQHITCRISLVLACLWVDVSAMQPLAFALLDALVCAKVASTTCHASHDTSSQRIAKQSCAYIGGCFFRHDATAYIECCLTCKRADTARYISSGVKQHTRHRTAYLRPTVVLAVFAHCSLVCRQVASRTSLAPSQSLADCTQEVHVSCCLGEELQRTLRSILCHSILIYGIIRQLASHSGSRVLQLLFGCGGVLLFQLCIA